jgi:hypothetical protein
VLVVGVHVEGTLEAPFNQRPPANFEGLYGKGLFNPGPNGLAVPAVKGSDPTHPLPDQTYE